MRSGPSSPYCCLCHCKDTNFKANHNITGVAVGAMAVVYATAKILILKQITTSQVLLLVLWLLFMPLQRY